MCLYTNLFRGRPMTSFGDSAHYLSNNAVTAVLGSGLPDGHNLN